MIRSFADEETRSIYDANDTKRARRRLDPKYWPKAQRLLDQLNRVTQVEQMDIPPSNRLRKLRGKRRGQWAVSINQSHRLAFKWDGRDASAVEIVDDHDE